MSQSLVVLGSVNADHILQVEHFPRPGETIRGRGYQVVAGGKGANQAVAAARLGGNVSFIACVGNDDTGRSMREAFAQDGMNIDGVMVESDLPTGIAIIYINAEGENCIGLSEEANGRLSAERIEPHLPMIKQAGALLMQLETPLDGCILAARTAREAGVRVVLNPAPARSLPAELLSQVDMITPNETEAEVLTGIAVRDQASAAEAAASLHALGISTVVITLGSQGAYISQRSDAGTDGAVITGFKVQAVDTTAAGDTFNAGLLVALLEGKSMQEAVPFAHAAAAISVTRLGAQTSIPRRAEVDSFLQAR
ncbi:ribokinase [Pokkaliibacter plantistimulans]|uniref:Ribokinase n=1 Tax=Pokkaliibacter plantistimulans TaxID=1635171 RepID=A0ABX5LS60_9GAMM|nr:ribokinase [Pokkaliibacter plantistimulans]PXF29009.1 ribokinase [Pokkaliibacter plantistimulans]